MDHYDYIVYIGRFQPFHKGHEYTVRKALSFSDKVIILCGSANLGKSLKNPWSFVERTEMIRGCFNQSENHRICIEALSDFSNHDDLWVKNVKLTVNNLIKDLKPKIVLIGYAKDESSYYLNLFPDWKLINIENYHNISATPIREALFIGKKTLKDFDKELPESVIKYLNNYNFMI